MSGDVNKVMQFLTEPPKPAKECVDSQSFEEQYMQVTELQMVAEFKRHCGIGRGDKWQGVILMPTAHLLVYMRNIVEDILRLELENGFITMLQSNPSVIVVRWQTGEELRLESCYCAKDMRHLRGVRYSFLGIVHAEELTERQRLIALSGLRSFDGKTAIVYEA